MRLVKITFVLAASVLMIACGGGKKESASMPETETADNTKKVEAGVYVNDEYGFTIKYPAEYFVLKEALDEGAVFISEDGKAELKIGLGNLTGTITNIDDFRKAYDTDVAYKGKKGKRDVTYNAYHMNNYVLMGYEIKEVFYQKTLLTKGVIVTAILSYDDAVKDTYYPMIEPIFNSFK